MSFNNISQTLLQAYVDGEFGLPTAYPNRIFTPTSDPWAKVSIIPNQPSAASLGEDGTDEHDGIMQIDLNYPLKNGNGQVLEKAEEIRALFKAGYSKTHNQQAITVRSCGYNSGSESEGYFRVIVTIQWYARTPR